MTTTVERAQAYDPVSLTIFTKALENISTEMASVVVRSSGSPVIAEAMDFATCILDADGEIIAYGAYIVSYVGTARQAVRHILASYSADQIHHGDVFICNDPFTTGSAHSVDVAIVRPVFDGATLVAWCWAFAHVFDFGGVAAGGFVSTAFEAYAEGLRLPGIKIVSRGEPVNDVWRLIETNIRVSQLVLNDIRCLIAACNRGNDRVLDLVDAHGIDQFQRYSSISKDLVEDAARRRISELPDGTYSADEYVEHNGHRSELLRIHCDLTVAGDQLTIDLSDSAPQSDGFVNCNSAIATGFASTPLFVSLLCDMPINEGAVRAITVVTKPGTIVDVQLPGPVSSGHMEAGLRVGKLVARVLADLQEKSKDEFVHGHIMAPWHDSFSGGIYYAPNENGYLTPFFDMNGGGCGGGAQAIHDGMDVGGCSGQTMNTIPDIEVNELDYPILYLWRHLNEGSGGLGATRGGNGVELAWTPWYTTGGVQNVFSACTEVPPVGVFGGYPGSASGFNVIAGGDVRVALSAGRVPASLSELAGDCVAMDSKQFGISVAPGDVLQMHVGGGGGFGDPIERDSSAVAADVLAGIISLATARAGYGVVVDDGKVDHSETLKARTAIREKRKAWPRLVLGDAAGSLADREVAANRTVAATRLAQFEQWCQINSSVYLVEYADPATGDLLRVEIVVQHGDAMEGEA